MRVLVTRPLEDVGPLVAALRARGHSAMVEPMLTIERRADVALPLPLDGVQALVFTSANGVRAFADLSAERGLPTFAVGDATAVAARDAGFATVDSAGGDVADLARLVRARLDPGKGALFHPAASQLAGDLQGALEDAGFTLRRVALYEAQPMVEVSPALRQALANGDLDAAVFFSPRTARTFVGLVEAADLAGACARLQAICLSEAVAARLAPLTWGRIWIAARPEQEALLARLDEAAAEGSMSTRDTHRPSASTAAPAAAVAHNGAADATSDNAHDIIAAFGGIRPMASKLGVAVSTVQGWRERGSIPAARHAEILAAAKSHGIGIDAKALSGSDRGGEPASAPETSARATATQMPSSGSPPGKAPAADEPPPRPAAASAPTATRGLAGRWWGAFALGVVAVVAGAGLAILGRDLWLPPPPGGESQAAAVAALDSRVAAVEGNVRAAGSADASAVRAAVAQVEGELAALRLRLDGLAKDVAKVAADGPAAAAIEQQAAALRQTESQLRSEIEALDSRVDGLDTRLAGLHTRLEDVATAGSGRQAQGAADAALALAVLQLRDVLRGSGPFAAELQVVLDVAKSPAIADGADLAAAVEPLAPYAATGVPTLAKLRADFPDLARAIAAQGQGAGDEGWLAGVKRRVSGLISVRPIGPVAGDSPAAVAARAEAALAADDLAGALRELAALQGPAAAVAEPWLAGARARLAARTALNELGRGLVARLGSGAD